MSRLGAIAARVAGRRPSLGTTPVILLAALFLVAADNLSFWQAMTSQGNILSWAEPGFAVAVFCLLFGLFTLVLSLGGCKYLLKPWLITLLIVASLAAYFMDSYGVMLDDSMLRNVLQTDTREAAGLWNPDLLIHLALTGLLPALLLAWVRIRYHRPLREGLERVAVAVVALAVAAGAVAIHYKDFALVVRNHRELRYLINPTYPLYSVGELALAKAQAGNVPLQPLGRDAARAAGLGAHKKAVLILVVGETARAANFGLDGYRRPTTPKLRAHDVINFSDFHSCGTSTASSVPCMFSVNGRGDYDESTATHTENLLDVLGHAGLDVLWRDNNSGCKGVCARVDATDMTDADVPALCNDHECFDTVLLHDLEDRLRANDKDAVIVLHQHGSHGPDYYRRHPPRFTRFTPECDSNAPQDCSRAAIVNAYDNTIVYTDYFLSRVIDFLQARSQRYDGAMFYVSDHGESLGENGIYLHGFPYAIAPAEQTHVPAVTWLSPGFARDFGIDTACMRARSDRRYSHDNLFSSMLGLLQISTRAYKSDDDMFLPCHQ